MFASLASFLALAGSLCAAMVILLEVGRLIGRTQRAKNPDGIRGTGPIEGAIFGVMGLLLAFTFSGAGARFEKRRELLINETNAIGTVYLRLSLLPKETETDLKQKLRQYTDTRIAYYRALGDFATAAEDARKFSALQQEIWDVATSAAKKDSNAATLTLIANALNEMIDITTTRTQMSQVHPPTAVYIMLAILLLCCALIAGYDLSVSPGRRWLHMIGFAVILGMIVYVILDYEYPRVGLLRIDSADQMLTDLRATMK